MTAEEALILHLAEGLRQLQAQLQAEFGVAPNPRHLELLEQADQIIYGDGND
jgi:hypothetical protein